MKQAKKNSTLFQLLSQLIHTPVGIGVLYLLLGSLWIVLSDHILLALVKDVSLLTQLQTYKGWLYVIATALLIVLLVRSSLNRLKESRELAERHRRELDLIVQRLNGVVYRMDHSDGFVIEYACGGADKLFGRATKSLVGLPYLQLVLSEEMEQVKESLLQARDNKTSLHIVHRFGLEDGSYRWILNDGSYQKTDLANGARFEGTLTDITSEIDTFRTLKESEKRFRTIVEYSSDGIFVMKGLKLVLVNPRFAEMFGYSQEEVLAHDFSYRSLITPEGFAEIENYNRTFMVNGKAPETLTLDGFRKDKSRIKLEVRISIVEWEGAQAALGVLRDTTEIRHLEQQLAQSQRLESVGRLAGGIAHDFNNMLTSIGGNAELAQFNLELGKSAHEELSEIRKITEIASSLTRQLLTFSRRRPTETRLVDTNKLISDINILIQRLVGPNITVETDLKEDAGFVLTDEAQMEQVIINLAVNARDAMIQSGGHLRIQTNRIQYPREDIAVRVGEMKNGEYVQIKVSDTGTGMSEEVIEKIFEPFFTTKKAGQGTGFGLATVYGIITQANGAIAVDSELGNGTTFTMYLPRQQGEETAATQEKETPTGSMNDLIILLVEDNVSVRQMLVKALKTYGLNVQAASEGDAALFAMEHMIRPPDLMISDVMMPGMNGMELAKIALEKYPDMRVILMSGYSSDVADQNLLDDSRVDFVEKPVGPRQLKKIVQELFSANGM